MFKDLVYKAFSLTLAILVLASTMSFTIEKHFCGNQLVDTAIFVKVQGCGMDMSQIPTADNENNNCCKNEVELVKGQDQLKIISFDDFSWDQQLYLASFTYAFNYPFEGLAEQYIPHKNYSPPNLVSDIQVLDRVFII